MSAMSRRKGASHEREIVNILKSSGHHVARNLDQVRDGGGDIPFGDFLIECKRRQRIGIYVWFYQCLVACIPAKKKPMLVIRADNRENLAVLRLTDLLDLMAHNPASVEARSSGVGVTDGQD